MDAVPGWLIQQGALGVALLVLGWFFNKLWNAREKGLDKREGDIRALADALNASTRAQERVADVVEANTEAIGEFSKLASARALAFDDFSRRTDDFVRRADLALQRGPR